MQTAYNPQTNPDPRYGAHPVSSSAYGLSNGAVSWGAIIGGSFATVAATLVLIPLGSGLGLSFVSPYAGEGMSAGAFTVTAAIWLIVIQWLSSGLGGYIAGRLRNRWEGLHGDEVFFRDSAHGFVSWAVATFLTAGFLISAMSAVIGSGTQAASVIAAGKVSEDASASSTFDPSDYYIDGLYRSARANAASANENVRDETARIFAKDMDGVTDTDKAYLSQLVAANTGLTQAEASARVDQTVSQMEEDKAKAVEAANEARKAAAKVAILTALSMVIGAFIAGVSGILGGRHRDLY